MSSGKSTAARPAPAPPQVVPPKVIQFRRRLLIALSIIFALWVAAMLAMYFTTVYPQRYPTTSPISSFTR